MKSTIANIYLMDYAKAGSSNGAVFTEAEANQLSELAETLIDTKDITEQRAKQVIDDYGFDTSHIGEEGEFTLQELYNKVLAEQAVETAFKKLGWYAVPEHMTVNINS